MKTFYVTFERTVEVEVADDANEAQVKAAAVEMYNDPPGFEDMYVTEESITSISEITVEDDEIG